MSRDMFFNSLKSFNISTLSCAKDWSTTVKWKITCCEGSCLLCRIITSCLMSILSAVAQIWHIYRFEGSLELFLEDKDCSVSVLSSLCLCVPQEPLGALGLARQVLSCVWPAVLKLEIRSEVDQWFDRRLVRYLPLLSSVLISPAQLSSATCLPYSKL